MDYLASNYEILVKTEPFLKFKKRLFKELYSKCKLDEDLLRRKFYKVLDHYLHDKQINRSEYKNMCIDYLIERLDLVFKRKREGSFVTQGINLGYIRKGEIMWVRHHDQFSTEKVKTFL